VALVKFLEEQVGESENVWGVLLDTIYLHFNKAGLSSVPVV
jgi:hypothetical protein